MNKKGDNLDSYIIKKPLLCLFLNFLQSLSKY